MDQANNTIVETAGLDGGIKEKGGKIASKNSGKISRSVSRDQVIIVLQAIFSLVAGIFFSYVLSFVIFPDKETSIMMFMLASGILSTILLKLFHLKD